MKNLKILKEKRNALMNELETMVSALENGEEVRALTTEERAAFDEKKAEIENIDSTIRNVEEMRAMSMGKEEVVKLTEERSKEEMEKRALELFFRGNDLELEERKLLASTSSNQALMPLEISKSIMQKLEELCPILEKATRFNSKGTLRLIKEISYGNAAITPEDTESHDSDVEFGTVELRAWKITAKTMATFEMLANTDIDLSNYLLDVIVRRLSKELNRLFLLGTGNAQPQGLINGAKTQEIAAELTINDIITMQTAMNPAYLDQAILICNRKTFQKLANMLDGTGRPYLSNNVIGEKIQYRILGMQVVVDENMDDLEAGKKPMILANVNEAYSINILTDVTIRHLTETGFTQGYEVFAGYVMADGKIVNDEAMVVAEIPQAIVRAKK